MWLLPMPNDAASAMPLLNNPAPMSAAIPQQTPLVGKAASGTSPCCRQWWYYAIHLYIERCPNS
ncbi:MAG: hypothetical protein IPN94_25555 [Sphingobacteriales bacterium]|nr:hypothetical protein [Sphingobacteriales bacterium]